MKKKTNTAKEICAICALLPIATKTVRTGRISESISDKADKRYFEAGNIVVPRDRFLRGCGEHQSSILQLSNGAQVAKCRSQILNKEAA